MKTARSSSLTAPWYHYIPLKPDYSDMYDILAFFVGPLFDSGEVDESKGHDVRFPSCLACYLDVTSLTPVAVSGSKDWRGRSAFRTRSLGLERHAGIRERSNSHKPGHLDTYAHADVSTTLRIEAAPFIGPRSHDISSCRTDSDIELLHQVGKTISENSSSYVRE